MPFEAYKLYQEYEPDKYKTSTQKKAEGVLKEADEMKRARGKETISGIEFQEAKELLGEDLIGPEEIEKTLGVRPEEIPDIPFSREELERAKEMGQMLVLRVEKTEDGKPMSLEAMIDIIQKRWDKEGKGKLLYTDNEYKNWKERTGADFCQKAPRAGWTLVSKEKKTKIRMGRNPQKTSPSLKPPSPPANPFKKPSTTSPSTMTKTASVYCLTSTPGLIRAPLTAGSCPSAISARGAWAAAGGRRAAARAA